mgnify:CR=1 FL=1
MQLQLLDRKEKLKFLDLALHLINIDGQMSDIESKLLDVMVAEVGPEIVKEYHFSLSADLNETLQFFSEKAAYVKCLVYLNLLVLIMLEDLYNTKEHFFLEDIRHLLQISEKKKTQLMRIVYEQRDLNEKVKRTIHE